MYSAYARQRTALTDSDQLRFEVNRKYGEGRQDPSYYKTILVDDSEESGNSISGGKALADQKRKSWLNVDFDNIITYAPKVRDHFHGLFRDMEQDVIGYPVDQDSGMMMKDKKLELLTELKFKDELAELRKKAGEKQPKFDFFPQDKAELDLYEASGGFKLNFAKAMEKLFAHTLHISRYEQLKKHWIDDAKDFGYVAGKRSEDPDTDEVTIDHVDPRNLIVQHSNYYDFRDAEFVGEIKPWTLSALGQYVDKDELLEYAKTYTGLMGNPGVEFWNHFNSEAYDIEEIGFFKVPVLESYFIDFEDAYEREYVNKYGKKRVIPTEYGYEPRNNNDKVRTTRQRYVYTGKWVVGSKRVFDYGLAYDQERQKGKDVKLPYRIFKVSEKPVTERLRPIYDQMQISWLKFQNAQAMAKSSGHAFNVRLLDNITLGGEKADPVDIVKFMRETGDLFYSDTDLSTGTKYEGGAVSPVDQIVGGMGADLQEAIQKFEWAVRMIEHIAGLSDVAMGSSAGGESQVGTTQMSVQGSQNVIRPIVQSIMDLKGSLAETVMFTLQLRLQYNDAARKMYSQIVGEKDVEAITQATKRGARFGVYFEPRPTQQEKTELYTMITQSMSAGKDGQPLLEADEALMIKGELMNGANLKDVRLKLSYKIRKRKEENRRFQLLTQQQQNRATMQQNAQKHQQEMQKLTVEQRGRLQEEQIKQQGQMAEQKLKANNELKQLIYRLADEEQKREMEKQLKEMELNKAE
jgi:hypothetical protein